MCRSPGVTSVSRVHGGAAGQSVSARCCAEQRASENDECQTESDPLRCRPRATVSPRAFEALEGCVTVLWQRPRPPPWVPGGSSARHRCGTHHARGWPFISKAPASPQPWHTRLVPLCLSSPWSLWGGSWRPRSRVTSQRGTRRTPALHSQVARGRGRASMRTEDAEAQASCREGGGISHAAGSFLLRFKTHSFHSE